MSIKSLTYFPSPRFSIPGHLLEMQILNPTETSCSQTSEGGATAGCFNKPPRDLEAQLSHCFNSKESPEGDPQRESSPPLSLPVASVRSLVPIWSSRNLENKLAKTELTERRETILAEGVGVKEKARGPCICHGTQNRDLCHRIRRGD